MGMFFLKCILLDKYHVIIIVLIQCEELLCVLKSAARKTQNKVKKAN